MTMRGCWRRNPPSGDVDGAIGPPNCKDTTPERVPSVYSGVHGIERCSLELHADAPEKPRLDLRAWRAIPAAVAILCQDPILAGGELPTFFKEN